jgi:hypothetical protein
MKITNAQGATGFLIWTGENYMFRRVMIDEVDNGHTTSVTFKDYTICHSDLEIEIQDIDATFYEDGDKLLLDHSPATLGVNYD